MHKYAVALVYVKDMNSSFSLILANLIIIANSSEEALGKGMQDEDSVELEKKGYNLHLRSIIQIKENENKPND